MKSKTQRWFGLALITLFLAPSAWGAECSNPTPELVTPTTPTYLKKTPSPKEGCIAVAGVNRKYYVSAPNGTPDALVVDFHGAEEQADSHAKYSRFAELAAYGKKTVVIFPQGIDRHWNDGRPNLYSDRDDLAFFDKLVEQVQAKYPGVKPGKTYVAGISNGGLMALRLACERSSALAGAGVVAAAMTEYLRDKCTGKPATSMVFIFGTKDEVFAQNPVGGPGAIGGGGTHIGIDATRQFWATRNSCVTPSSPIVVPNTPANDGSTVEHYAYNSCTSGKKIAYFKVVGGGHRWPDAKADNGLLSARVLLGLGWANNDIDSYQRMATHWGLVQ